MTGAFDVISPLFASFKAKKMVERNMCVCVTDYGNVAKACNQFIYVVIC